MAEERADAVGLVSGRTRLFGIVGDPIEQVRSPEMFTSEFHRRGHDAVLVPIHVRPDDFDGCVSALLKLCNLDGLVFTIPYKARAMRFAGTLGANARIVGAINALARGADGRWKADIFDGLGCVEAFRRRGVGFADRRVMLLGAGGAGSAIAVAVAFEHPRSLRIYDPDAARATALVDRVKGVDARVAVETSAPLAADVDILLNASPVGMLDDARMPINADSLPRGLLVFDAIVTPERTRLLALAESCGCTTIYGREMMRGQIEAMVDFFGYAIPA
ncbi:MAG TPA: shikimate dehydrogenase [Casimicrobiaceae bacterium]|jgi:shikimate dehydrogenase|nr:shikimate dehydrogenase [Casimicrobiaceae bacterium]